MKRTPLKKGKGFAASPAQRKKAKEEACIVTAATGDHANIDPAHLVSRAQGGCDSELCVVPLERSLHRRFDNGELDISPYLVGKRVAEVCHALEHYEGSISRLQHRLTGQRHVPISEVDNGSQGGVR